MQQINLHMNNRVIGKTIRTSSNRNKIERWTKKKNYEKKSANQLQTSIWNAAALSIWNDESGNFRPTLRLLVYLVLLLINKRIMCVSLVFHFCFSFIHIWYFPAFTAYSFLSLWIHLKSGDDLHYSVQCDRAVICYIFCLFIHCLGEDERCEIYMQLVQISKPMDIANVHVASK